MNKPTEEQLETAAKKAISYTARQNWATWVKHLVAFLLGGAAAVASFFLNSCAVTPERAAQVQGAHNLYHAVTGKPCVFVIQSAK